MMVEAIVLIVVATLWVAHFQFTSHCILRVWEEEDDG